MRADEKTALKMSRWGRKIETGEKEKRGIVAGKDHDVEGRGLSQRYRWSEKSEMRFDPAEATSSSVFCYHLYHTCLPIRCPHQDTQFSCNAHLVISISNRHPFTINATGRDPAYPQSVLRRPQVGVSL